MSPSPVSNSAGKPANLSEDVRLLEQAQKGDLAAFDQLVLRNQRQVFAVALRMLGNADEAQDIAQEAFIHAYRAIKSFRREAKVSTWLVSIVMNLCRNRRRLWARRRRFIAGSLDEPHQTQEGDSLAQEAEDPGLSPAQELSRREQQQQIAEALQQLDEAYRSVIVLRDIEGYAYEEIARMLGCRVGTIKSRISRAREQLQVLLEGKV